MTTLPDFPLSDWTRRRWLALSGLLTAGIAATAAQKALAQPEPAAAPRGPGPINVAIVLGLNNTIIDFAGPWEVLSSAGYAGRPGFNVYSVAKSREPVTCDDGRGAGGPANEGLAPSALTVIPDYSFEDAPQPRITLIGAQTDAKADQARKFEWLRHAAQKADLTASVCTGAFQLGGAGLLDGQSATTNRSVYDQFEKQFPKVKLVRGVRFVESGRTATATGLTAGIDLSLRIVERFYGREAAQKTAEYEEWSSKDWIV